MIARPTTTAKRTTMRSSLALLAVLAAMMGTYAAVSAGAPALGTPTIADKPADPTNRTTATFRFASASAGGVTYQCSLDGAAMSACSSPATYDGLAAGSHTFQVRARRGSTGTSATASHTWTVDTTPPPAPQITGKPASLSNDPEPAFAFAAAESGVTFQCRLDGAAPSACTSPLTVTPSAQGTHTFRVAAVDAAGNASAATAYSWRLDSVVPPAPRLTSTPARLTRASSAGFAFDDAEAGVAFECRRDSASWSPCTSPVAYRLLSAGLHTFAVRALDLAGNRSVEPRYDWLITRETTSATFSVSGDAVGKLYPGAPARAVTVRITNPHSDPIFVTRLEMTVTGSAACSAATNLVVTQASVSETTPVIVPPGGSVTLPAQGISAPTIAMHNLPASQDACQNATFALAYSGSAQS
jgi:hypothetical protein